jgi:hypothetical protein
MSYGFSHCKTVKSRKPRRCEQCGKEIETGVSHVYTACVIEGSFYTYREHEDCRSAMIAVNNIRGADLYEGIPFLKDDGDLVFEKDFLEANFPAVFERLFLNGTRTSQ